MERRPARINIVALILLIILIVVFNRELFILGVRIFAALDDSSAKADRLLANYYRNAAHQNAAYADKFYSKALNKQLTAINQATPEQKASINFMLGRYFECGRGTKFDLAKAKTFFQEAKNNVKQSSDKLIESKIDDALTRVDMEMKTPNVRPVCEDAGEKNYFNTWFISIEDTEDSTEK